jgi:hypothetical protein
MIATGLFEHQAAMFIPYEFGTDVGVKYLNSQLDTWGIGQHMARGFRDAAQTPGFDERLRQFIETDLAHASSSR